MSIRLFCCCVIAAQFPISQLILIIYHHYHTINIVIYQHTEDPAYVSVYQNCLQKS